jgi:hypothetical protein
LLGIVSSDSDKKETKSVIATMLSRMPRKEKNAIRKARSEDLIRESCIKIILYKEKVPKENKKKFIKSGAYEFNGKRARKARSFGIGVS